MVPDPTFDPATEITRLLDIMARLRDPAGNTVFIYKAGEAKWEQEVPFGPITVVPS